MAVPFCLLASKRLENATRSYPRNESLQNRIRSSKEVKGRAG